VPLVERIISDYEWLASHHGELDWWEENSAQVRDELEVGYACGLPATSLT
jgi:hypothetical protein